MIGLVLSSSTALWMTASTFDLLPDGGAAPAMPAEVSGGTGFAVAQMQALKRTPVSELRELSFPYPGDVTDVFTLKTDRGTGYLDQGTGALLAWTDPTGWERVSETIYMLHTGKGAAPLGLVLGIMALGVPAKGDWVAVPERLAEVLHLGLEIGCRSGGRSTSAWPMR